MREVVSIETSDTGKAIEPQRLETIFNSFEQEDNSSKRQYGGAGLGLTIIKQLAELMNEQIKAHSSVGECSTFSVHIKSNTVKKS